MRRFQISFILIVLFLGGCVSASRLQPAPALLPLTERAMQTPGFWIARHPDPDRIVLDAAGLARLNRHIRERLRLTQDIFELPERYPGVKLKAVLNSRWKQFKERDLYFDARSKAGSVFFDSMLDAIAIGSIPDEVPVRYGFIVHYADQRFLPTRKILSADPGDIDFDELQNSALDVGEPIAILHESADGGWVYVLSRLSDGWVRKSHVALSSREEVRTFASSRPLVVTAARTDIYLDEGRTKFYDHVRMGTRFPFFIDRVLDTVQIVLPLRQDDGEAVMKTGYVLTQDVSLESLAYTPRTIIEQAFKLLYGPYGWGGMYGGQDCSRFLQKIFATVGVELPRDSKNQIQVGKILHSFNNTVPDDVKKETIVAQSLGGVTLLGMKGHIMLYLGEIQGEPHAIHSVWAYRQPATGGEITFIINGVTVSTLTLGEGSKRGSWLQRIISLNSIQLPQ